MWSSWYEMWVCLDSIRATHAVTPVRKLDGPRLQFEAAHSLPAHAPSTPQRSTPMFTPRDTLTALVAL